MTPKERAAMTMALEALEACVEKFYAMKSTGVIGALPIQVVKAAQTITALREALAEQAEQEPVGYLCEASFGRGQVFWFNKPADNTPLYAAPVRTKDLTPHEITALIREGAAGGGWQGFAQRVIAADREKNK